METQLLARRDTVAPTFAILAHVNCGQTAGWIKMPLGMEVGLGPDHIVLVGDPAPAQKGGTPHFLALVCCGQTAGWIKISTWHVGRPHCVRWGPSFPPKGTQQPPLFGPCLLCPNGRMDQDTTWYGEGPRSMRRCVSSPKEGDTAAPTFGPLCSCTVAPLSCCWALCT